MCHQSQGQHGLSGITTHFAEIALHLANTCQALKQQELTLQSRQVQNAAHQRSHFRSHHRRQPGVTGTDPDLGDAPLDNLELIAAGA